MKWARLESNQHALAGTCPSSMRVLPIPPRAHFLANQGRLAVYFSRRSAAVNRRNEGLQRRLH